MAVSVAQKRLYGNDNAPSALTTGYTVPASTSAIVTCITISNKTSSPAGVLIKLAGVTITSSSALIDANSTSVLQINVPLVATETIQVQASASSAIALTISGVEVT